MQFYSSDVEKRRAHCMRTGTSYCIPTQSKGDVNVRRVFASGRCQGVDAKRPTDGRLQWQTIAAEAIV